MLFGESRWKRNTIPLAPPLQASPEETGSREAGGGAGNGELVLVTDWLDDDSVRVAVREGCERVAFVRGNPALLREDARLRALDVPGLDRDGGWRGWSEVSADVEWIREHVPGLLRCGGFDLTLSVKKALWWSMYEVRSTAELYAEELRGLGYDVLVHCRGRLRRVEGDVRHAPRAGQSWARSRTFARALRRALVRGQAEEFRDLEPNGRVTPGQVLLLATSVKQAEFFSGVFRELRPLAVVAALGVESTTSPADDLVSALRERDIPLFPVDRTLSATNTRNLLALAARIVAAWNRCARGIGSDEMATLARQLIGLAERAFLYDEIIRAVRPSAILVNAFEVAPPSDVLIQAAHRRGARVVNTMNGIKAATASNCDTRFDAWCVWTEAQRDMLVEDVGTPPEQLVVTGHLQADVAATYSPSGAFDWVGRDHPGKRVVVVFSQPQTMSGSYRDRFFETISGYVEGNPHVVAIIKPHPREDVAELRAMVPQHERLRLVDHDPSSPTEQLYDLLSLADLTVVMFTTVALESLFFQTPVISLNFTGIAGVLPLEADGTWVFEETTEEGFGRCATEILSRAEAPAWTNPSSHGGGGVASAVADVVRSLSEPGRS